MAETNLGAAVLLGLLTAAALAGADAAEASDIYVQLSPSTAAPGQPVGVRAGCRDNSAPATVESPAFGMVAVQPHQGVLTTTALVPVDTQPGTHRVRLSCPDGANASTMLTVGHAAGPQPGPPRRGPATGFGGAGDEADPGDLLVPGGLGITFIGLLLGMVAVRRRGSWPVHAGIRR